MPQQGAERRAGPRQGPVISGDPEMGPLARRTTGCGASAPAPVGALLPSIFWERNETRAPRPSPTGRRSFGCGGETEVRKMKCKQSKALSAPLRGDPLPAKGRLRPSSTGYAGEGKASARNRPPHTALFSSTFPAYITPAVPQGPAMAINGRRNKPFGPGGSTRRLHPCSVCVSSPIPVGPVLPKGRTWALHRRGRNRIDEGVKDVLLPEMVPT
jgi:hypothetical protein